MASKVGHILNRPILAEVNGADVIGGVLHFAAVNIRLDYEQVLLIDGLLASFRLQVSTETGPRLNLIGLDNVEITGITTPGSIFQFRDPSKLVYLYDQWLDSPSDRIEELFTEPLRLYGSPLYSFGFGATAAGAAAGGWDCNLQVLGRIVNKNELADFPYRFR